MNWQEAVQAMREGKKVRCWWFSDDCYLYINEFNRLESSYALDKVVDIYRDYSILLDATLLNDWEVVE
jgi:hypothetical protein